MAKQPSGKGKKPQVENGESPPVDYSKPLKSSKHEAFCLAYMITHNATQAAKDAGYSEKTAYSQGQRLLKHVEVRNRLTYLHGKAAEDSGISIKKVGEGFKKIAFGRVTKTLTNKNILRALENLGKHIGFYKEDNSQKQTNLADFLKAMTSG